MNLKEIKELIDLITEKNLAEFEMEKAGFKIKVVRNLRNPTPGMGAESAVPHGAGASSPPPTHSADLRLAVEQAGAPESVDSLVRILSPIVGTFYRAPEPNAPTFVKEGDRVSKGQTLCIIEAMKLMNEIEAETDGEIVKILVENGRAVEYGQELFYLRPSA